MRKVFLILGVLACMAADRYQFIVVGSKVVRSDAAVMSLRTPSIVPASTYWLPIDNEPAYTMPDSTTNNYIATNQWWNTGYTRHRTITANEDVSFGAWFNYKSCRSAIPHFFGNKLGAGIYTWAMYTPTPTVARVRFQTPTVTYDANLVTNANDGTWHHIACTRYGATDDHSLFFDGVFITNVDHASANYSYGEGLRQGGASTAYPGWGPAIKDVIMFSGLVSTQEWVDYIADGSMPAASLILRWAWTNDITGCKSGVPSTIPAYADVSYGSAAQPLYTNSSLLFDGINDEANVYWVWDQFDDKMTFSFWINLQQSPLSESTLFAFCFGNGVGVGTMGDFIRYGGSYGASPYQAAGITFQRNGFATTVANVLTAAQIGEWHHTVITYDRTNSPTTAIYFDTVAQSMFINTASGTMMAHDHLMIGGRTHDTSWKINAYIDDVRMWDSILTTNQIVELNTDGRSQ